MVEVDGAVKVGSAGFPKEKLGVDEDDEEAPKGFEGFSCGLRGAGAPKDGAVGGGAVAFDAWFVFEATGGGPKPRDEGGLPTAGAVGALAGAGVGLSLSSAGLLKANVGSAEVAAEGADAAADAGVGKVNGVATGALASFSRFSLSSLSFSFALLASLTFLIASASLSCFSHFENPLRGLPRCPNMLILNPAPLPKIFVLSTRLFVMEDAESGLPGVDV